MLLGEWLERHQRLKPGLASLLVRAGNALAKQHVRSLDQLCACSQIDLLRIWRIGPATVAVLEDALAEDGLRLKDGR
jgi:DNA-directed RNA polymerase alpha subunit